MTPSYKCPSILSCLHLGLHSKFSAIESSQCCEITGGGQGRNVHPGRYRPLFTTSMKTTNTPVTFSFSANNVAFRKTKKNGISSQNIKIFLSQKCVQKKIRPDRCLLAYRSTCNAFFMDLPVSSFMSYSSLVTAKSVNLAIARDGFPSRNGNRP